MRTPMPELKDIKNVKAVKLEEELLSGGSSGHESRITKLQQVIEYTQGLRYLPLYLRAVTVHALDGQVYENQPVILCDGPKDEALIWEVPGRTRGHPDIRLYRFSEQK